MLGIESINVWVMLMAIINTESDVREKNLTSIGAELNSRMLIKLTCIPGVRPVIIPKRMPANNANRICMSIGFLVYYSFICSVLLNPEFSL